MTYGEPCPCCQKDIPEGAGVVVVWHRLHYWCWVNQSDNRPAREVEIRQASGAML